MASIDECTPAGLHAKGGANVIALSKRVLEPIERVSEVLFGLIMVLSITSSVSIAESGEGSVRTLLLASLGCNLAWGVIDGVFYLMGCLAERGRNLETLLAVRDTVDAQTAQQLIAGALPPLVASVVQPDEFEASHHRLRQLPERARPARLAKDDYLGGLGVFLLVFLSTFPVVIPFLLVTDVGRAVRVSNGVGIAMLFVSGHVFGRAAGRSPWGMALLMVLLGVALVAFTIALGG